jgi:hypothetical protein
MGSQTNNPFQCESTVDGKPCGNLASSIYKSAIATRLVCDTCARRYKAGGPGGGATNLMEFSLMELIPAREVLVMKLGRSERLEAKMKKMVALGLEEINMLDRLSMWMMIGYAIAFFILGIWGPAWSIAVMFASYIISMLALRRWASVRWLPGKMEAINKEHGFPERENY